MTSYHCAEKTNGMPNGTPFVTSIVELLSVLHSRKALAAIDGTIAFRLEGHSGFSAAGSAGGSEELTGTAGSILACVAASLATLGLVLETALRVEFLLAGSEHELFSTFLAY